jgi:hypothetical protein
MSNRKATFAKRQRETELKDHARAKEERRSARRSQPRVSKGPEIAWDQAIDTSAMPIDDVITANPDDEAAESAPEDAPSSGDQPAPSGGPTGRGGGPGSNPRGGSPGGPGGNSARGD